MSDAPAAEPTPKPAETATVPPPARRPAFDTDSLIRLIVTAAVVAVFAFVGGCAGAQFSHDLDRERPHHQHRFHNDKWHDGAYHRGHHDTTVMPFPGEPPTYMVPNSAPDAAQGSTEPARP